MLRHGVFLLSTLLPGCSPSTPTSSTLSLQLVFAGTPITCASRFNIAKQHWQLQQFQLYLSDFQLNEQPVALDAAAQQNTDVALLGSVCDGNEQWQLHFDKALSPGNLSFTLGVPERFNHQNPLLAMAPLNQSDMYWSWQQGYKYLRLELVNRQADAAQHEWALHLGATGCTSASALRAPTTPCSQPNRARISLAYQPGQTLQLDLAPLLEGITLSADNHCMSDPNRLSCQSLLPRLGINAKAVGWSTQ